MLIWVVFAILVAVPLVMHVRGGGIVALSLSTALLYGVAVLWVMIMSILPQSVSLWFFDALVGDVGTQADTLHDTYVVVEHAQPVLIAAVIFGVIALVFWALTRWGAPLRQDRLKSCFWLLHVAILALPFATLVFLNSGIFENYIDGPESLPALAMSSAVVSIAGVLAVAVMAFTALGAAIKRLRM